MAAETQTKTITNFGGRLTRIINGDLDSGFAKYDTSFGYDPFSKPMNLTWLETYTDITTRGVSSVGGTVVAAKPRGSLTNTKVYAVSTNAKLYEITSNSINNALTDNASVVGTLTGSPTFNYGASMDFFGSTEKIHVTHDAGMVNINFDGSASSVVGVNGNFKANSYHALRQYSGKLAFGNGNTIGVVDATGTVTSSVIGTGQGNLYSQLNPPLGVESFVADLDVSKSYDYLLITASSTPTEGIMLSANDIGLASGGDGMVAGWNGSDATITTAMQIPSYAVTALQTYLANNTFFSNDSFGASLNDGTNKILTLPRVKSPLPNATATNGNFLTWWSPEVSVDGTTRYGSLFYFGGLDQENPPGLYRVLRYSPQTASGFVYQAIVNVFINNHYQSINTGLTATTTIGYGKHYLSVYEQSASTTNSYLLRFLITPTGTGTPQLGVYETQTQLFGKRVTLKQARVYTEPTASGNGFKLEYIDSAGTVMTDGNTNTYTFVAGTDPTQLQGSLERIDFNPSVKPTYAAGLRITNTGTTNMTIKKIELDYQEAGK